ncbi:hypothetical protein ONS95_005748 [Cadophora gregata]|uniref:uncharacterized protein n=1 Tax=Cadophora gregata TaxID=51156 RepID=UPI0026DB9627|nr:uncharacterized protein ONS95_005748 [Cadophora gregata]KAK0103742.1 hypothetical protein ONS95_005748 [Cadophora gregata]KAK0107930.1 hypothetical protein ONS96_003716 [Cadophora gregata f. sp. sojae]
MATHYSCTEFRAPRPAMDRKSVSTLEEYLNPSAIPEVREALRQESLQHNLEKYREQLCNIWTHPRTNHLKFSMWRPADQMLGLTHHAERESRPFGEEYRFLNKATVFYWAASAKQFRGTIILGGIWHTWFAATGQEPDFLLDPFFATPIFIDPKTAETVPEIVQAHQNIYAGLHGMQERLRTGHPGHRFKSDPRHFRVLPLCGALIAVFDEYKWVVVEKRDDGFRHCEELVEKQSILLVRTGREEELSAPISFESLKPYVLPLSRNEDMGSLDVVRVPLLVGVRFVADLLLREEKNRIPFVGQNQANSNALPELDLLTGAREWSYRAWESFRMGSIVRHGLADATADEVKRKLRLTAEDLSEEGKIPMHFDMGWY